MQELFPREAAASPEVFTGERLTSAIHGQVEIEHYHRYLFSRGFCRDRDVLDVASGEGYGTAHLAQVARQVIGVEFAEATARNAAANFPRPNLWFIRGDARSLPLIEGSVDVVTSFETIEHFDRQDDFVADVRRVLRNDGCFIVSTPDRDVYSAPGAPVNPFHVHEFDRIEFLELLHRHFRFVALVRQRPMLASALVPEEATSIAPLIFERVDEQVFSLDTSLPKAPYLLAIASQSAPRLAPVSLFVERSDIDNVTMEALQAEMQRMRVSERVAREATASALATAEKANENAEQARSDAEAASLALSHTRAALAQANSELDRISGSARQFIRQYIPRLFRHLFH